MKIVKNIIFFLTVVLIVNSCSQKRVDGVYVNSLDDKDSLHILGDSLYYRSLAKDTNLVWLSEDKSNIQFSKWVNSGQFYFGDDITSPILNCRYRINGRCYKLPYNDGEGGYYKYIGD